MLGSIDFPPGLALANSSITIAGWALPHSEATSIEFFIDGLSLGTATLGQQRADVARGHPNRKLALSSGFKLEGANVPPQAKTGRLVAIVRTIAGDELRLSVPLTIVASVAEAMAFLARHEKPRLDAYFVVTKAALEAGDHVAAQKCLEVMRTRFEETPARYVLEARCLVLQDRLDEAEGVLSSGVQRFPGDEGILGMRAQLATQRLDWAEALVRWRAVRERFPQFPGLMEEEGRALHGVATESASAEEQKSQTALGEAPGEISQDRGAVHAKLMLRFESLGHNCDFGGVQRHFGSEPLGLLRFGAVSLRLLITALDTRFDGLGLADNTRFEVRPNEPPEYWVWDSRYNFAMHTFIYPDKSITEEKYEKLFRQQCRRLVFLKDKLISDLSESDKIFIHQRPERLSDEEISSLFRAIRRYGRRGALLCVRPQEEGRPGGTVEMVEEGLFVGYLDRFPKHSNDPPSFGSWLTICTRVNGLWPAAAEVVD